MLKYCIIFVLETAQMEATESTQVVTQEASVIQEGIVIQEGTVVQESTGAKKVLMEVGST